MADNTLSTGQSIYTLESIETRSQYPLYRTIRELLREHHGGGYVLDIGCSDGVATYGMDGVQTIGVDLSLDALAAGHRHNEKGFFGVVANMQDLPFDRNGLEQVDTVVMLEVLEHEKWENSRDTLRFLRENLPDNHHVIVSMPIISNVSIRTWYERLSMLLDGGRRPPTGLYDRTHQIFTNRKGHHSLFTQAGYAVADEYQTNHIEGVTGEWRWKADQSAPQNIRPGYRELSTRYKLIKAASDLIRLAYSSSHSGSSMPHRIGQTVTESMVAYQGIYVLQAV